MITECLADFDEFKKQVYLKLKIQSLSSPSLADVNTTTLLAFNDILPDQTTRSFTDII